MKYINTVLNIEDLLNIYADANYYNFQLIDLKYDKLSKVHWPKERLLGSIHKLIYTDYKEDFKRHIIRAIKIRSLLRLRRKLRRKFAKIETSHFGFLSLKNFALWGFVTSKTSHFGIF